ncbi:MAG: THUMP domain-containing protein [Chitinophagales bacterium]|nr:THUMP domain-containing protein [Chitinophagales bacterium]
MEVFGKELIITTLSGLEKVLVKELQLLGIREVEEIKRGVKIPYSLENIYLTNLACRVALKVFVPVYTFEAKTTEELYSQALRLPWQKYQKVNQTFSISNVVHSQFFTHSKFAALKVKDALCDAFRKSHNKRPNVEIKEPDVTWHLHIFENKVTILLDSSGYSLHKRGYRRLQHDAPINEVLACGLLYLSEWDAEFTPLIDGMTGSGTIAIEAAMMASRMAPNLNRNYFSFKNWKNFDSKLFDAVRQDLMQKVRKKVPAIIGIDISPRAIEIANTHARLAKVQKYVQLVKVDFIDYQPISKKGLVLMNPPYGERLEVKNVEKLYEFIGSTLKKSFTGWTAGMISNNKEAIQQVGLNSKATYHLMNGKLECDFKLYELFEGKKKGLVQE